MEGVSLAIVNGSIYTGEAKGRRQEALAVKDGRIVAVGSNADIDALVELNTRKIDAQGNLVIPGFIDSHVHFLMGGLGLIQIDLREAKTELDFAARIAARAGLTPPGQWLIGGNWDHEQWPGRRLPTKELIDSVTSSVPVFVTRLDIHMALVNSAALRIAGITGETPDPPGGAIVRDPQTGEPTGILKDAAMELVRRCIPKPTTADYTLAMQKAMTYAASLGITSVHDVTAWDELNILRDFHSNRELTVRIAARTPVPDWQRQRDIIAASGPGDNWLHLAGVKGFVDGSLGSATALLFSPYADAPETSGLLHDDMHPTGIMEDRLLAVDRAGLQSSIHAIGDKANHILLDILDCLVRKNGLRDRRFRIEHAQHLIPEDVARMARLGAIASMQPAHALDDARWAHRRLGDRTKTAYPLRALLDAGVPLAFGTDWPVVPLSPFPGLYAAITRKPLGTPPVQPWHPEQRISAEEALYAYTTAGAYAEFAEQEKGTLTPGKLADLAILSQDILQIDPKAIPATQALLTICGGRIVHEK